MIPVVQVACQTPRCIVLPKSYCPHRRVERVKGDVDGEAMAIAGKSPTLTPTPTPTRPAGLFGRALVPPRCKDGATGISELGATRRRSFWVDEGDGAIHDLGLSSASTR